MTAQTDLFSLMDDPTFTPYDPAAAPRALSILPERKPTLVTGWLKSYCGPELPAGSVTTLPTLNRIENDGHHYIACCFALKPVASVWDYPGGFGLRGIRLKGSKLLISLYDAVQKEMAAEVETEEVQE